MHTMTYVVGITAIFIGQLLAQNIDPTTVPISTRDQWCSSQTAQCPLICLQTIGNSLVPEANSCDPTTLLYSCICSNGLSPNASQYSETIPYFECTQYNSDCVANCPAQDSTCQSACVQNNPCGAQSPTRVNTTTAHTMTSTSTRSTSTSNTAVYTGFGVAATSKAEPTATATATPNNAAGLRPLFLWYGEVFGTTTILSAVAALAAFSL